MSGEKILCADDDADIRMILEFSLASIGGYQVRMCADGTAAVREARAFRPDLILLDVMMPGVSGPQTLRALREQPDTARTPVVFLTAKAMADDLEELLQYGATGVIVKPFDPVALPANLRIYLEHGRGAAA